MSDFVKSYDRSITKRHDEGLRQYMLNVYNYMTLGLVITALTAVATLQFPPLRSLIFNITPLGVGMTTLGSFLSLAPIFIALYFFMGFGTLTIDSAKNLMWVYSALMGISLSSLGLIYTGASLVRTLFICASVFGAMSIYGYTTKKDLTAFGSFATMGLIGLIIASVVNIFMQSSAIYFATSLVGVAIFVFLIAWDTQKLKQIYYSTGGGVAGEKMAIFGAMNLYLDFINLYIYLLRFTGTRRS